ncbi:NAD(P)-dependent dehydrogenase (short-subunit alcohol dehydrogenase family) [Bradyrhizobium sp. i1.3.1]
MGLARQYAAERFTVIACCREPAKVEALKEIAAGSGGRVRVAQVDLADKASIAALKRSLVDEPIDILVHNAGVNGSPKPQTAYEIDGENWIHCMRVNALGPMLLSQALLDNLKRGRDKKLVAISSSYGSIGRDWPRTVNAHERYAYRASKAALNSGMRALSRDWAEHGVVVGILDPGWVRSDMGGTGALESTSSISADESAKGIIDRIAQLTPETSGTFQRFSGEPLAW